MQNKGAVLEMAQTTAIHPRVPENLPKVLLLIEEFRKGYGSDVTTGLPYGEAI